MNKALSLIMCYAVGMVAFVYNATADVSSLDSSIDFSHSALWGQTPRNQLDDYGIYPSQDPSFWHYVGGFGNQALITNYTGAAELAARYSRFHAATNPRPDYMQSGSANQGYLKFLCVSPLERAFNPVDGAGSSAQVVVPPANDLFVDSLVRFEPRLETAGELPTVAADGRSKFICWLSAPEGSGQTNLIVTAGYFGADGALVCTNYLTTAVVEPGVWYRLTARAIANAATQAGKSAMCFALYLDGQPVTCDDDYAIGADAAQMAARFAGNEHYARRGLFPVIRATVGANPSLYGLSLQGAGALDELGVVNSGNPLAVASTTLPIMVAAEAEKVTNIVCAVTAAGASEPYQTVTNDNGSAEVLFEVKPGDSVVVSALPDEGYTLDTKLAFSGNVSALANADGFAFTMVETSKFSSTDRLVARINIGNANFSVDGRTYESMKDALAAAAGDPTRTLKLESDVTLDPTSENGQMRVLPQYDIVFDLNGRKLVGRHFMDEATVYDQGRLTIVDSQGGGAIIAPGTAIEVVSTNDALDVNHAYATLALGSTTVTGPFTVKGRVRRTRGELILRGGTYLTPADLDPDPYQHPTNGFYLAEFVDSDRFSIEGPVTIPGEGNYWSVGYDGRLLVRFAAEVGEPDPVKTNVFAGSKLIRPRLVLPGYAVTNWCNVATGRSWDFANDTVEEELSLLAQVSLDRYQITYDIADLPPSKPTSYTVTSDPRALPVPTKAYLTFAGWRDSHSGERVDTVGAGAVFVGTTTTVTGNLDLVSQWVPQSISWSNVSSANSESNGTYAGSWTFVIPPRDNLPVGARVAIDEIAFGIVNPLLYPKTANYLAVVPQGAEPVVSAARQYGFDPTTQEYLVGENRLANGRAKVGYAFDGLTLEVGATNEVRFSSTATVLTPTSGFLRLTHMPGKDDPVFGNCSQAGGTPTSDQYLEFCPTYEVRGHLEASH